MDTMSIAIQSASGHSPLPQTTSAPQRVLSIDVLRGLTIALMILVNDPGDWAHTYTQLDHAPWNGFTLTDFVFPNFLFIVGASIIFSLQSRIARGESKRALALHILRRAAIIFAIDVFLSPFPQLRLHPPPLLRSPHSHRPLLPRRRPHLPEGHNSSGA